MKKKKEKSPYSLIGNIRYIYRILFHEVKVMPLIVVMCVLLGVALPFISNLVITAAVVGVTSGKGISFFILITFLVLAFYGASVVLYRFFFSWNEFFISHVQSRNFLLGLVMKSLNADYDNIEPQKQQALLTCASHAVHMYRRGVNLMYSSVPYLISGILGLILYSLTITMFDFRILIMIIFMNAIGVFLSMRGVKVQQSFNEEQYAVWGRFYYLKRQTMSTETGKDIRIFGMKNWFLNAFQKDCDRNLAMWRKENLAFGASSFTMIIFTFLRDLLTYGILVKQVLEGRIGIAEVTFGIGIVAGFSNFVYQLQRNFAKLFEGSTMMKEYRKMIDYPDRFKREDGLSVSVLTDSYRKGALPIEFRHVSFQYEENGPFILKNVNFSIKAGEKIALVGHNGAGKTTLIKLLCGLYHPTEGEIVVGGHSIEEFNLLEYQKLLSTIFQDVNTLPLSILENVSSSTVSDTNRKLAMECIEKAGLLSEVQKLPKQEMTYLTQTFAEDGIQFSGGMEQKLMMARAMYKQAPILVLDEPTAALDPIAESHLYEEYNNFSKNKTSIFISHRLASTRFCDRIIYLENGEVTEEGTHHSLMEKKGKYAEVFQIQSQYYKEEENL